MRVADPKTAAGRAFVRSLNILLKYARLYGYDHARTVEQLKIAYGELCTAIPPGSENGLLLGATGSQLLLLRHPRRTLALCIGLPHGKSQTF